MKSMSQVNYCWNMDKIPLHFQILFIFSSQICWDIAWDHKLICHYTWHGGPCNSTISDQICKLQFIAFIYKCKIFYLFYATTALHCDAAEANKGAVRKLFMPVTDVIICLLCINANIKCFKRNLFFTFVIMK